MPSKFFLLILSPGDIGAQPRAEMASRAGRF